MKNPKPGYPSCSIFPEGVHCAQQHCEREREPPSRSLPTVASCWLGDVPLFLMASEGTRGEGKVLELLFSVWDENYFEDMQLAPTKYFLE